jgi:hypothetical protein
MLFYTTHCWLLRAGSKPNNGLRFPTAGALKGGSASRRVGDLQGSCNFCVGIQRGEPHLHNIPNEYFALQLASVRPALGVIVQVRCVRRTPTTWCALVNAQPRIDTDKRCVSGSQPPSVATSVTSTHQQHNMCIWSIIVGCVGGGCHAIDAHAVKMVSQLAKDENRTSATFVTS